MNKVKIRSDFVTNSSSSSFILGFKDKDKITEVMDLLPEYWSEEVRGDIISDIEYGITTKDEAIKEYQEHIYTWDWEFNGKTRWDMTKEERLSDEYQKFIQNKKNKLSEDFINELNQYDIISIVNYEDHTRLGSELEHNIMPYLKCTIERLSHH